jgi:hypothetical protein
LRAAAEELKKTGVKVGDAVSEALKTMEESEIMRAVRKQSSTLHWISPAHLTRRRYLVQPILSHPPSPLPPNLSEIQRLIRHWQRHWLMHLTILGPPSMLALRTKRLAGNDAKDVSKKLDSLPDAPLQRTLSKHKCSYCRVPFNNISSELGKLLFRSNPLHDKKHGRPSRAPIPSCND